MDEQTTNCEVYENWMSTKTKFKRKREKGNKVYILSIPMVMTLNESHLMTHESMNMTITHAPGFQKTAPLSFRCGSGSHPSLSAVNSDVFFFLILICFFFFKPPCHYSLLFLLFYFLCFLKTEKLNTEGTEQTTTK